MNLIVSAFLKYLESHPDVVEKLIEALVKQIIDHLNTPPKP